MISYKKIIAILLALVMLFGLAACKTGGGNDSSVDSSVDSAVSVEESSESAEERAVALYKSAVDALNKKADIKQKITAVTTRTVGTSAFKLEQESTVVYNGNGTDKLTVHINEKNISGSDMWRSDKFYANGKYMYSAYGIEGYLYTDMSKDAFADLQLPLALISEDLYESVSFDGEDESTIVFANAIATEEWLAPDYAKLVSAEAKAKTNANGEIEQFKYTASYTQGPASFEVSYTVELSAPEADDKITLPEGDGTQFDGVLLLDVLETARIATTSLIALEVGANYEIYSQAGAISMSTADELYTYGTNEKDFIAKASSSTTLYAEGQQQEYNVSESIKEGELTMEEDGETITVPVTMKEYLEYYFESDPYESLIKPDTTLFESFEVNDLVEYLQISYKFSEEGNKALEDYVTGYFYEDAEMLDKLATAYTADKAEGYICIDKDTMLITAAGIDFAGTHTIEGQKYITGYVATVTYKVATADTYEEITGEMPEEAEPEDKPTPLFYKVTAPDGGIMYMLGTIHVGDNATAYLPNEVYSALENADALAVEFDIIAFEELLKTDKELAAEIANVFYYSDKSLISTHIEEELYKAGLQHALTAGVPAYAADYLTPATWAEYISNLYMGSYPALTTEQGVDRRLLRIAKEKGIDIINVEDPKDQYGMPYKYTDDIHRVLLLEALNTARAYYIDETQKMYDMWCDGDEKALTDYIREEEIPEGLTEAELKAIEEYDAILGADRDEKMVEKAKEYMASGKTVFFAVGLAHIVSETGLVDSLRADGYTVELVQYGK